MKRRKISRSAGSEMLRRKRSRYAVVVMTSSTVTWANGRGSTGEHRANGRGSTGEHRAKAEGAQVSFFSD